MQRKEIPANNAVICLDAFINHGLLAPKELENTSLDRQGQIDISIDDHATKWAMSFHDGCSAKRGMCPSLSHYILRSFLHEMSFDDGYSNLERVFINNRQVSFFKEFSVSVKRVPFL